MLPGTQHNQIQEQNKKYYEIIMRVHDNIY